MDVTIPHWCHGSWAKADGKPETLVQTEVVVDRFFDCAENTTDESKSAEAPRQFMALFDGKLDVLLSVLSFLTHEERARMRIASRDVHNQMAGQQKVVTARYRSGSLIEVMPLAWTKNKRGVTILLERTGVKLPNYKVGDEVFFRPPMIFKAYDQEQDFPRGRIKEVRSDGIHVVETWSWRLATGKGATIYCQWGDIRRCPSRTKFEMLPEQRVWRATELKAEATKLFMAAQADEKMVTEYDQFQKQQQGGSEEKKPAKGKQLKLKNTAFVFVKPHATKGGNDRVGELVKSELQAKGLTVVKQGTIDGPAIEEKRMIDQHYFGIANRAVLTPPASLSIAFNHQRKFEKAFSMTWFKAVQDKKVHNLETLKAVMEDIADAPSIEELWDQAKADGKVAKLGGGFYVAPIKLKEEEYYLVNGFYQAMRAPYVQPDARIVYYSVEWDPAVLSFKDFREKVLGATNPAEASEGSLRRLIMEQWEALGLDACPDTGDNGVHGSASPFESLMEHHTWLGTSYSYPEFGKALLGGSLSETLLEDWSKDPVVTVTNGDKSSLFDALENLDAVECCLKARSIAAQPVPKYEAATRQFVAAVGFVEGDYIRDPDPCSPDNKRATAIPCAGVLAGIAELKITTYNAIATCCKKVGQLVAGTDEGEAKKRRVAKEQAQYGSMASNEIIALSMSGVRGKPVIAEITKRIPKAKLFGFMLAKALCLTASVFIDIREYSSAMQILDTAKQAHKDNPPTKDLAKLMDAQKIEIDRMYKNARALNKKQQSKERGRWSSAFEKNSKEKAPEPEKVATPTEDPLASFMSAAQQATSTPQAQQQQQPLSAKQETPAEEVHEEEEEEEDDEIGYGGWAVAIGTLALVVGAGVWFARRRGRY